MAGEIQVAHSASGKTLYALVRNATGSVWQTTTSTFVSYASANLTNYQIALTEQGTASRYYAGSFPAASADVYALAVYEQAGASAAEGDPVAATGPVDWDGAAVVPLASRATSAAVWTNATRSLTAFGFAVTVGTNSDKTGYALATAPPTAAALRTEMDTNSTQLAKLDATISSRLAATAYTAPPATSALVSAVWQDLTSGSDFATASSIGKLLKDNLDAAVSSRLATAGYTAPTTPPTSAAIRAEMDGNSTKLAHLDADVTSRLAAASYTAPDNTSIGTIKTQTDHFSFDASGYVNAHTRTNDDKAGYSATVTALTAGVVDVNALALDAVQTMADALLDRANGVETGYTPRQALRLILSVLAAKLSGAGSTLVTIRDVNDTRTRVAATVDASGNRTALTLDAG